jgi:hypothetical protein
MSTFEDTYQTVVGVFESYQVKDADAVSKAILSGSLKMDKIKERLYNLVNYNDKHRQMFQNSNFKLFKTEVKTLNVELFPPAKIKKIIQTVNNDKVKENAFWYYLHRLYLQVCMDKKETTELTTKLYANIVQNDPSQYEQRLKAEEAQRAADADRIVRQMYEFLKMAGIGGKGKGGQVDLRKIGTMMNTLKDQFGSQMNSAKLKISDLIKSLLKMAQEEQLQKQEGVTNTTDDGESTGLTGAHSEGNLQKIIKITELCDELQSGKARDKEQVISILESMKDIEMDEEEGGEKIKRLIDKVVNSIRNGERFEIQDIVTSMFSNDQGVIDGARIAKDLMSGETNPLALLTGSNKKNKDEEELERLTAAMAAGDGEITEEEMAKFEELAKRVSK